MCIRDSPITELQEDKTNVYLCKLAIEHKQQYENKTYVSSDKILSALKDMSKNNNINYKRKKEYNIRNGIKPWLKNGR